MPTRQRLAAMVLFAVLSPNPENLQNRFSHLHENGSPPSAVADQQALVLPLMMTSCNARIRISRRVAVYSRVDDVLQSSGQEIRRLLSPWINGDVRQTPRILLRPGDTFSDLVMTVRFIVDRRIVPEPVAGNLRRALDLIRQALQPWRPPALGGPARISYQQQIPKVLANLRVDYPAALQRAFQVVARARFLSESQKRFAAMNDKLDIPEGQTTSDPSVIAWMTLQGLTADQRSRQSPLRVLVVGAGTGYATAIIAEFLKQSGREQIHDRIVAVEIDPVLAKIAAEKLQAEEKITVRWEPQRLGAAEDGPFDCIFVFAETADPEARAALARQLSSQGRMVLPWRNSFVDGSIVVLQRSSGWPGIRLNEINRWSGPTFDPLRWKKDSRRRMAAPLPLETVVSKLKAEIGGYGWLAALKDSRTKLVLVPETRDVWLMGPYQGIAYDCASSAPMLKNALIKAGYSDARIVSGESPDGITEVFVRTRGHSVTLVPNRSPIDDPGLRDQMTFHPDLEWEQSRVYQRGVPFKNFWPMPMQIVGNWLLFGSIGVDEEGIHLLGLAQPLAVGTAEPSMSVLIPWVDWESVRNNPSALVFSAENVSAETHEMLRELLRVLFYKLEIFPSMTPVENLTTQTLSSA